MHRHWWAGATLAAALFVLSSVPAKAEEFSAKFSGFEELPAIVSPGTATLKLTLDKSIAAQNVTAGDFDALVAALTSDTAYGNIHTSLFPAGEIRGQIHH